MVQSPSAIENDIKNGMHYYYMKDGNDSAGYIAIKPDKMDLYLSKFYVDERFRGKGFGKLAINFANDFGKDKKLKNIFCYCANYNTTSLMIYEKLGFRKKGEYVYSSVSDEDNEMKCKTPGRVFAAFRILGRPLSRGKGSI